MVSEHKAEPDEPGSNDHVFSDPRPDGPAVDRGAVSDSAETQDEPPTPDSDTNPDPSTEQPAAMGLDAVNDPNDDDRVVDTGAGLTAIRRDTERRWAAGVCAGLARRYRVPVAAVRAAAVVLSPSGISIVAYVAATLFIRDEAGQRIIDRRDNWSLAGFAALAVLAWTTFPENFEPSAVRGALPWLVLLAGWALIVRSGSSGTGSSGADSANAMAPTDAATPTQDLPQPTPTASTSDATTPLVTMPPARQPKPPALRLSRAGALIDRSARRVRPPRSLLSPLGPVALLLAAATVAVTIGVGAPMGVGVGIATIVLGLALVVGSKVGHARILVFPVAALALLAVPAIDADVQVDDVQTPRLIRATETSPPPAVNAAIGSLDIDLSSLAPVEDVSASYELYDGDITVLLPAHMRTVVEVHTGAMGQLRYSGPRIDVLRPAPPFPEWIEESSRSQLVNAISTSRLADATSTQAVAASLTADNRPLGRLRWVWAATTFLPRFDLQSIYTSNPPQAIRRFERTFDPVVTAERLAKADGVDDDADTNERTIDPVDDEGTGPVESPSTERGETAPTLHLTLRSAMGRVQIIEPVWASSPDAVSMPTVRQTCVEAGGSRGVVSPCQSLPMEKRVPTCLLDIYEEVLDRPIRLAPGEVTAVESSGTADSTYSTDGTVRAAYSVIDCREVVERDGYLDARLLACSDGTTYLWCTQIGIKNSTRQPVVESEGGYTADGVTGATVPPISGTSASTNTSAPSLPTGSETVATIPALAPSASPPSSSTTPPSSPATAVQEQP